MTKKITLLVLACTSIIYGYAQFTLQTSQKFNLPKAEIPYAGMDYLRILNPKIIMQTRTGYNSMNMTYTWQDLYKFTTFKADFGNNIFSELGVYEFDTIKKKWRDNWVERYSFDYNYTNKHVRSFEMKTGLADTSQNYASRTRYIFDNQHRLDTEYLDRLKDGIYELMATTSTKYDSLSQIIETEKNYSSGFYLQTLYTYDPQGRLTGEFIFSKYQSPTIDSNLRKTYVYDSAGRIVSHKTEIYKISGSPFVWTTTQYVTYQYNSKGQVSSCNMWTYDYTQNYKQVPQFSFTYTYTPTGKLESYLQIDYISGLVADKMMYTIEYDSKDDATEALAYTWNGAGYNLLPSYRFIYNNTIVSAIEKTTALGEPTIYPNPCIDVLNIGNCTPEHISILDITGKEIIKTGNVRTIDISELAAGIYFVKADNQKPVKFIKE